MLDLIFSKRVKQKIKRERRQPERQEMEHEFAMSNRSGEENKVIEQTEIIENWGDQSIRLPTIEESKRE